MDRTRPALGAGPPEFGRRATRVWLFVIVVLAGILRLPGLDHFPPGLHQDEAANAWNAWCLLKTGCDQVGARWPIFYMRELGSYRTPMFAYVLLPFQALGGMNLWTNRLPAALGGLVTILLIYWVGARLFDRPTGLAAAALLALNPVHIQLSRYGNESCLTPLLALAPLAAWLWAGLPLDDRNDPPGPGRAILAGLVTGVCCYGYAALRLFLPLYLTACVLVTCPAWLRLTRTRRGLSAVTGLLLALAATFGPLAYKHITEPHVIGRRAETTWIWSRDDPLAVRAAKVLERWAQHFHPDYLFEKGDADEAVWAVPFGFLPRYLAPALLTGLIFSVPKLRASRAARVLLVGVLLFPIGDAFNWHVSLHSQRTAAGLCVLILLGSLGISRLLGWLLRRRLRVSALAAALAFLALIAIEEPRFLKCYFGDRSKRLTVYYDTHQDLLAACDWLRPRLAEVDDVICFPTGPDPGYTPWVITLVALQHDPRQWFAEPREADTSGPWDRYTRYGKFYFLADAARGDLLEKLRDNDRTERVILFLRPQDPAPCGPPAHVVRDPSGTPTVLIYDCQM
jgi:4-amino-4-deoxy-L-arabinose transferase-like glycosyltransferase